jgi:drug/metabolite transporter (DMT)-like permease
MLSLWVFAAILAGLFQSLRSAMQQSHRERLTVNGAAMVRHLFGLPYVLCVTAFVFARYDVPLDGLGFPYFGYVFLAAMVQIFGTIALIHSFTERGYLVGTAFSKTEALQAGLVAALLFGERLGVLAWVGLAVGVGGVLLVATQGRGLSLGELRASMTQPAAGYGLAAAALLAATGLLGKEATGLTGLADPLSSALITVTSVMIIQCFVQGAWMLGRDRAGLASVMTSWRTSTRIGLVSAAASLCWFVAIALAPVALVRIVGQAEVVFTVWLARAYLKETPTRAETAGLILVAGGVILSLLGAGS